jgi:thiol:disulfide interchange protein DsbD
LRRLIAFLTLFCALAAPAFAAGPQRTERIEAELVAMSDWAAPGSTAIVAVRQKIQPGWHTYWRNPGDSGGATTLDWTLPPGVTAGEIVWPTPERQRLLGLMNYGYSGEVFLPVPIDIPADAPVGRSLTLTTKALFLVCSDQMCVPDELTLSLDLPIREGAAPLSRLHGAAIQRVVEAAPRPAGIAARVMLKDGVLTLTATGGPVSDAAPAQGWFFPFEGGIIDHAAPQTGQRGSQGLTLTLAPGGELRAGGLSGPIAGVLATPAGAWEITAEPGEPLPGASGLGALQTEAETEATPPRPFDIMAFLQAAGLALLGGLILNLMPCVFPILAMKAAALAASAHQPREARRDGLLFLAGVLTAFLALAGALLALRAAGEAVGWGFQLQSPAVVAGLALLMLAVGLNLSGVYHMGAGLQGAASGPLARLSGGASAFMTGVLAVVVAAPCTAPFMAVALGAALVMAWPLALIVFLMLGLGLALPYVLLSLSPRLLARLPRPGLWMERLRGVLAFPMYGAAAWLIWVFTRQTGAAAEGVLLLAALLIAFALWLAGRAQAERAEGRRGSLHAAAALVAALLAIAALVLAVRAPRETPEAAASNAAAPSSPWSRAAVSQATAQGRPVLVNFTADWCVTCKLNERALNAPRVTEAMARTRTVYLVGDWTRRDDAITRELALRRRSGVPLYLVYSPGEAEPRILPQLLTEGLVVQALDAAAR